MPITSNIRPIADQYTLRGRRNGYRWLRLQFEQWRPPLTVILAGISRWRSGDRVRRSCSQTFSVNLVTAGEARFTQNEKTYMVGRGECFICRKGCDQYFTTGTSGILLKRFLMLDGPLLHSVLKEVGLDECDFIRPSSPKRILQIMRTIYSPMEEWESADASMRLSLLSLELLMLLGRHARHQPPPAVVHIIDFMRRNIGRRLSLRQISSENSLSVRTCNRLFNRHLGTSPLRFFIRQKMLLAEDLLVHTQLPVKEIARMTGYENPFYFTTTFHRRSGLSPQAFRRRPGEQGGDIGENNA